MSKAMAAATAAVSEVQDAQTEADFVAAREWLEAVSGTPWTSNDLWENTKDGVMLCKVVNTIRAGGVAKVNRPGAPFKEMENLTNFISACKAIINCIHALSKASKRAKGFGGPYLEVEKVQARSY